MRRGLTNPGGLKHILGLTSELRTLEALHAKVFMFDKSTVFVGSTNMSESSLNQYRSFMECLLPRTLQLLEIRGGPSHLCGLFQFRVKLI